MPEIANKPFMMQNAVLNFVADDYAAACSSIALVPTSSIVNFTGLKKNTSSFPTTATWLCQLKYAQDWETASALAQYLHEHEGSTIAAQVIPNADDDNEAIGQGFDVNLIIVPGQIGGDVNQVATSQVSLGVQGKPTYIED